MIQADAELLRNYLNTLTGRRIPLFEIITKYSRLNTPAAQLSTSRLLGQSGTCQWEQGSQSTNWPIRKVATVYVFFER